MLFAYRASRLTSGIVFFWNNYSITATSALSEAGESSLFRLVLDSDLDNHSCGTIRDMSSPRRWDKDCWIVLINRAVSSTAAYFLVLSSVSITSKITNYVRAYLHIVSSDYFFVAQSVAMLELAISSLFEFTFVCNGVVGTKYFTNF